MRFTQPLDHVLRTQSRISVLRYLILNDVELNGRQIARAIGASPKPLNQVLAQLVEEGVLIRRNIGRVNLFRVNRSHPLVAEMLAPLFQAERTLLQRALIEILQGVDGIVSVVVYGSVGRQTEQPHSDIDVLVIAEDETTARAALEERAVSFLERYNNVLSPYVIGRDEFRQRYQAGDAFLREVLADGLLVTGCSPWELLHGAR